jgi:hypothetical protein
MKRLMVLVIGTVVLFAVAPTSAEECVTILSMDTCAGPRGNYEACAKHDPDAFHGIFDACLDTNGDAFYEYYVQAIIAQSGLVELAVAKPTNYKETYFHAESGSTCLEGFVDTTTPGFSYGACAP